MDLGLAGKTAIVGASSKGLGEACALVLAAEGAHVTVCARTAADLEAAAAELRQATGAQVLAVPADLGTAAGIEEVVAATVRQFGGVDVLVTNSGGPPRGAFADFTDDDWLAAFELVTLGFVRFVRAVTPLMRARGSGRIIGIQSSSVKQPVPGIDLSNGLRPGIAADEGARARPRQGRHPGQPGAAGSVPGGLPRLRAAGATRRPAGSARR